MKACENLVDDTNIRIMETSRSYEKATFELNKFYEDLQDMIKTKKNEQLKKI